MTEAPAFTHSVVVACPREVDSSDWRLLMFTGGRFHIELHASSSRLAACEAAVMRSDFLDVAILDRPVNEHAVEPHDIFALSCSTDTIILCRLGDHEPGVWVQADWLCRPLRVNVPNATRSMSVETAAKGIVQGWKDAAASMPLLGLPLPRLLVRHNRTLGQIIPSDLAADLDCLKPPSAAPLFRPPSYTDDEEEADWIRIGQNRAAARR